MKKLIIIASLAFVGAAYADNSTTYTPTTTGGVAVGQQQGQQQASTSAVTVGCLVNCTDQTAAATAVASVAAASAQEVASTTQVIKNTPSVSGPALVTSNDTCMGSTSGSVNIAGLGIGGGSTWTDTNCKMLKNSRELWNMGMKAAAMALMCTDSANREALELTGYVCPQTAKAKESTAKAESSSQYTGNDPVVRARLGLTSETVASK